MEYVIQCNNCFTLSDQFFDDEEDDAIEKWNTREYESRISQRDELIREMWKCFYVAPYVCVNPEVLRDRAVAMGIDMEVS